MGRGRMAVLFIGHDEGLVGDLAVQFKLQGVGTGQQLFVTQFIVASAPFFQVPTNA